MDKPIIYQLLPRFWGNKINNNIKGGTLEENGCGKFSDIDNETLEYIKWLGCSHVWLTGIIRHSTKTSSCGCTASHPQFVKGKAGSPYAITDYYDVNPYLADKSDERMSEFEHLINRVHEAGLKVLIDFVPNHVARDYGQTTMTPGHPVLGENDNQSVHWSPDNDFFYYPGEHLRLPSCPENVAPYDEYPAKASGNSYTSSPSVNDWYETIRINYCDFHTGTWDKMYDAVRFWASKGVDGFRCDMVELVPAEFFTWLIPQIKCEFPQIIFIAEVYKKELYKKYIREVGFDYLYDKSGLYDTLRAIVEKNVEDNIMGVELWQSTRGITSNWQFLGDLQPYMLNFLENHDEQRFASDFFGHDGRNSFAALYASLFFNRAPFMLYFGEELAEKGMDEEGFSGKDGRTTIFDWWGVSSLHKLYNLIHSGLYKSIASKGKCQQAAVDSHVREMAGLTEEEAETFVRYSSALRFSSSPAISKGMVYDLCYCNYSAEGFDKDRHFAFLRDYEDDTLLIVLNFSKDVAQMELNIPEHAFEWLGLPITPMLNPQTKIRVNVQPMDGIVFFLSKMK